MAGLGDLGWRVAHRGLDATFPRPTPQALGQARSVLEDCPDGATVVVDGLAYGAMPGLARAEGGRLRLVALVHHPLAEEVGLPAAEAEALRRSEARALAEARVVVATSRATAGLLAGYDVAERRLRVVEPGTDPAPAAAGARGGPPRLLCVGALVPRKGHDLLLRALARVADLPWHLDCVGDPDRDPGWSSGLVRLRDTLGLAGRVAFAGALPDREVERAYAAADLFVLATRFEGYGMVLGEALAHGLPVLATRTGAAGQTVPPAAGVLVEPGDADAFAAALRALLGDEGRRWRLAAGSRAAARRLPTWPEAAAAFAAACEEAGRG
jgi:glycosyltransferase involved in cell wall biosynthesis